MLVYIGASSLLLSLLIIKDYNIRKRNLLNNKLPEKIFKAKIDKDMIISNGVRSWSIFPQLISDYKFTDDTKLLADAVKENCYNVYNVRQTVEKGQVYILVNDKKEILAISNFYSKVINEAMKNYKVRYAKIGAAMIVLLLLIRLIFFNKKIEY